MASLFNTKISNTYVGLLKMSDNLVLSSTLREISDGSGNASGVFLNTSGDLKASGILEFGSLKDTGENITITKFVDEADGIANNDNDTSIPTSGAIIDYVAARITLEDLDFSGDSGTGSVDLDSQVFAIVGTANEIETSAGSQQLQIGLPSNVTISSNLQVNGLLKGNNNIIIKDTSDRTMAAFYGGDKSEIYFNDNKKFETTSDGVTVTGGLTATAGSTFTSGTFSGLVTVGSLKTSGVYFFNGNSISHLSNSNLVIGFNSTTGFRVSTDGGSSNDLLIESGSISGSVILDEDNFASNSSSKVATQQSIKAYVDGQIAANNELSEVLSNGNVTGATKISVNNTSSGIDFIDDAKARFGTGNDLEIYHSGNHSFIHDNGTGELKILSSAVSIQSASGSEYIAFFAGTGGQTASLYAANSKKFETSSTGVTITGVAVADGLQIGDDETIQLGDSQEFSLTHTASGNSIISENGSGNLFIDATNFRVRNSTSGGEDMISADSDGSVTLYNNNVAKLTTSGSGVTVTGVVTSDGLDMGDNEKIRLGDSQDLEIYHDGSHSRIVDSGTGHLTINATDFVVNNSADTKNMIIATDGGSVNLYYDASQKFRTISAGVEVTGTIVASGDATITGDGSFAGGDITLGGSAAKISGTSGGQVSINYNTTSNQPLVFYGGGSSEQFKVTNGGDVTIAGSTTIAGDLTVNGTTTTVNTQTLAVEDPLISLAKDNSANSVDIGFYGRYNDGSNRYAGLFSDASDSNKWKLFKNLTVEPTTTVNTSDGSFQTGHLVVGDFNSEGTASFTSTANFSDNAKAQFGNANDLQIYHDGSNSHIIDNGTGSLFIRAENNLYLRSTTDNQPFINCEKGGAVELFHNDAKRFETSSTGVAVTGSLTVGDSHTIGNDASDNLEIASSSGESITLNSANKIILDADGNDIFLQNNGVQFGVFGDATGAFHIDASVQDDSIKLRGNDGGSTITALELDMANNGKAIFSGEVSAYGNSDTTPAISIYSDANHGLRILHRGTDGDFSFETRNNGTNTEFLRVARATGNTTFRDPMLIESTLQIQDDFTISNSSPEIYLLTGATHYNWMVAAQENVDGAFEITPSNAVGTGGTFDTPAFRLDASTREATFAGKISGTVSSGLAGNLQSNDVPTSGEILHLRDGETTLSSGGKGGLKISSSPGNDVFLLKRAVAGTGDSFFSVQNNAGTEHVSVNMASGSVAINNSSGDSLTLTKSTTEPSLRLEGDTDKDFVITVSGELLTFTQNDGATDILTLDHDTKAATFGGGITTNANNTFKSITGSGQALDINLESTNTSGFGSTHAVKSTIRSIVDDSSNAHNSKLQFFVNNTSGNLTNVLTLQESITTIGNSLRVSGTDGIKINTTADLQTSAEKFSVNGLGVIKNDSTSAATLYIQNHDSTADTIQPYIYLSDSGGNRGGLGVETSTAEVTLNGQGGINLSTGSSGVGGTKRMTIDSTGDLTMQGGRIIVRESDNGNDAVKLTRDADEGYLQLFTSGVQNVELRGNGISYIKGGNFAIGTTSTQGSFGASNTLLTVKGTSSGGEGIFEIVGLGNNATDIVGRINFHSQAEADAMCSIRSIRGSADDIGSLVLSANNGGSIDTNNIQIDTVDGSTGSSNAFNSTRLRLGTGAKTGWGDGDVHSSIEFYNQDTSGAGARNAASIQAVNTTGNGSSTTTFDGALHFKTSAYNTAETDAMYITSSQALHVGIGSGLMQAREQSVTIQCTLGNNGVAIPIAYVDHTHALDITVIVRQDTSNVASAVGRSVAAYGAANTGFDVVQHSSGNISNLTLAYLNTNPSGQDYVLTLTPTFNAGVPPTAFVTIRGNSTGEIAKYS